MPLVKRSTHAGLERQCGPTLMFSILSAVLVMFAMIGVFAYHSHRVSQPKIGSPPSVSTLPKQ